MKYIPSTKFTLYLLLFLHGFIGITACIGGIQLLITHGSGMPESFLKHTIFSSFMIPSLILFFIVGGTQLIACYFMSRKMRYSYEASAIASFGILIWIFTQIYLIREVSWLQIFYFSLGVVSLSFLILLEKLFPNIQQKEQIHNRHWYE